MKKKKLYEPVSTSPTPELKSYTQLRKEISHGVPGKSFGRLTSNALVLCQEITLSTYFLARHRISIYHESTPDVDQRVQYSTLALFGAQVVAMFYSIQSRQDTLQPSRRIKAAQRIQDGALLAILLRFVASVIRALTASYSTDTVELLTAISMIVHLLTCDYTYANGFSNPMDLGYSKTFNTAMKRPPFLGGTLSLNAAFFATVLAVSRIQDNTHAYFFVSLAIILFAFYPFTRHAISESFPPHQSRKWRKIGHLIPRTYGRE